MPIEVAAYQGRQEIRDLKIAKTISSNLHPNSDSIVLRLKKDIRAEEYQWYEELSKNILISRVIVCHILRNQILKQCPEIIAQVRN